METLECNLEIQDVSQGYYNIQFFGSLCDGFNECINIGLSQKSLNSLYEAIMHGTVWTASDNSFTAYNHNNQELFLVFKPDWLTEEIPLKLNKEDTEWFIGEIGKRAFYG